MSCYHTKTLYTGCTDGIQLITCSFVDGIQMFAMQSSLCGCGVVQCSHGEPLTDETLPVQSVQYSVHGRVKPQAPPGDAYRRWRLHVQQVW